MGKFIIIQDMRQMPSYRNVHARLVYMHVAMGCDIASYTYATSLRRLAMELDMTVDTIRHALKLLRRDGLIDLETAPQGAPQAAPQGAPQGAPQRAPHLTILKIKKNGTPNGTPNTTPSTTPSTTESTTPSTTDKNNKIIKNKKIPSHEAGARACEKLVMKEFGLDSEAARYAVEAFFRRQSLKGKTWQSDGDCLAHLLSWLEKRLPRQQVAAASKRSDHEARTAEYQRTLDEVASQDEVTRLKDEVQKLLRWRHEAASRKDKSQVHNLDVAIDELKRQIETKRKEAI